MRELDVRIIKDEDGKFLCVPIIRLDEARRAVVDKEMEHGTGQLPEHALIHFLETNELEFAWSPN